MAIEKHLTSEGYRYFMYHNGKPLDFPIEIADRSILLLMRSDEGEEISAIEQLYMTGLIDKKQDGEYLLPFEKIGKVDKEYSDKLSLPTRKVTISLREVGHFTTDHYQITYDAKSGPRNLYSPKRVGPVLKYSGIEYLLDEKQWKLIEELERWTDPGKEGSTDRARHQAYVKLLARDAGIEISSFMAARESLFADNAEIDIRKQDDKHLDIIPKLPGVPDELNEEIFCSLATDKLKSKKTNVGIKGKLIDIRHKDKQLRVFLNDQADQKIGQIRRIESITGKDVPRFLENPEAYLPESIEYDPEVFAKRVKGLKILRSSVVPYVHLKPRADRPGWFDLETGVRVENLDGDLSATLNAINGGADLNPETLSRELSDDEFEKLETELMQQVSEDQQDDWVYIPKQGWINVKSEAIKQHAEARKRLREAGIEPGLISPEHVNKVLDIYTNLESLEYNEGFLQQRLKPQVIPYEQAPGLNAELYEYQKEGYRWMCGLGEANMGGLLADDMGMGKTLQIIAYLLNRKAKGNLRPSLIVMPLSILENWKNEISKFAPSILPIMIYQGEYRQQLLETIPNYDLTFSTYETIARDQLYLGRINWKLVISDESQRIKNFKTRASHAAKGMHAIQRLAMTGTPVENRLSELWSIIDFIQPGLLRSYGDFRKTYEIPIMQDELGAAELTKKLVETIKPVFLRRTKEDIFGKELPPPDVERKAIPLGDMQFQIYKELVNDARLRQDQDTTAQRMNTLAILQRLIQVCSHPRTLDEGIRNVSTEKLIKESPKLEHTMGVLENIRNLDEKVLIYTKYYKMQEILRRVILDKLGVYAPVINGEIVEGRQGIVDQFNKSSGFNVMILSPRAAGVGLNITGANHVIHYTREWNPAVENQATDRVHRIGQKKKVKVYYPIAVLPTLQKSEKGFISRGISVEQRLNDLLEDKRALMKNVIVTSRLDITQDDLAKEVLY